MTDPLEDAVLAASDLSAELMLVNRVLVAPDDLQPLRVRVSEGLFFHQRPKQAWLALCDLADHGHPITAVALKNHLAQKWKADAAAKFLAQVFSPESSAWASGAVDHAIARLQQVAHQRERARLVAMVEKQVSGNGEFREALQELAAHEERDPLKPLPWVDRPRRSRIIRSDEFAAMELPTLEEFVFPAIVIREGVTLITGPSKAGKSVLSLNLVKSLLTGGQFMSRHPVKSATLLYLQTEMAPSVVQKRLKEMAVISDRFWVRNVEPGELKLNTSKKGDYGRRTDTGHRKAIVQLVHDIRDHGIDVLIVDPIYELLDGSETDEFAMKSLFESLKGIARYGSCALVAVHHTKKRREGDWEGPELASGHNVLTRAPDALLTVIEKPREDGTKRFQLTYTLRHAAAPRPVELLRDEAAGPLTWRAVPWSDEGSLDILGLLDGGGRTAPDIVAELDMSKATVYRRLKKLEEAGEVENHGGLWLRPGGGQ